MTTSKRAPSTTKKPAKTLGGDVPLSFTLNFIRDGGSIDIDGVTTATLASAVENRLADHRTVEELIALVANRLVCQHDHWTYLGTDPPDLELVTECLVLMLHYAPHGFSRRDLEWLVDVADDQQVRYNVLGFMRFLDTHTGELNLDEGTGFTPQYVR